MPSRTLAVSKFVQNNEIFPLGPTENCDSVIAELYDRLGGLILLDKEIQGY